MTDTRAQSVNIKVGSRRHTETERIKVGDLKPIYLHREYDKPGGSVVSVWLSCGSRYRDQDMGKLMEAISKRLHSCFGGGDDASH